MSDDKATVAKAPCKSCPYRQDVPSGVWDATEYDKLPAYDGEILHQLLSGGEALFYCHQQDGHLCAGWVGCHGASNLLAFRFHAERIDDSVWGYVSPVPVFASGQEACDHGKAEIDNPGEAAHRMIDRLVRKLED
jgi:hypothetical protein